MGGVVHAESAVGVGSRFWLDLPFDPGAAAPAEADEAEELHPNAAPVLGRSLRVLVAEDDALNAAMLRAMLEQLGHQVVHAHDGRRALELAELCNFDLIMLDGRMPHLTGPEAAREIRSLAGAAGDAPIIAVIGGDAEDVKACVLAGADEVLRKPVTVAGVARAVAAALGSGRRQATRQTRVMERIAGI
jgi:CheY-like chemotaxis protein